MTKDFLTLIEAMAATFNREVTEATYAGYWMGLDDQPLDRLKKGVRRLMRDSRFMPTVADIREVCYELQRDEVMSRRSAYETPSATGTTATELLNEPRMACALKRIKEIRTEGERQKFLDEFFGDEPDRRDAYRCVQCEDTGWVSIFHPATVVALAMGEQVRHPRKLVAKCDCDRARQMASRSRKKYDRDGDPVKLIMYGTANWHVRCNDPDGRAKCAIMDLQSVYDVTDD